MKKQIAKGFPLALILAVIAGIFTTSLTSCKKTDANAQFLGTYVGTVHPPTGLNYPDTLLITAGSSSSAILFLEKAGGAVFNGTVSGSTINIPMQTVTMSGGQYPVSGSGNLTGSTLTTNYSVEMVGIFSNYVFTGTKQ